MSKKGKRRLKKPMKKISPRKKGLIRTSLNLHEKYIKAIEIVKEKERIYKSEQVELGLKEYLKQHEALLAEHGINLWTEK